MTFYELRKRKYKTVTDFCEKTAIPVDRVYKWEQGASAPKIKDLPIIAKALGVSVTTLVKCFGEQSDEM